MSLLLDPVQQYNKELMAMRYWLLGKGYHTALAAMEFSRELHTGMRKDNVHPSFSHQLYVANYIKTLVGGLTYPEATLAAAFLHDVCEDKNVGFEEIVRRFGEQIGFSVKLLTKKHRGIIIPYQTYFANIAQDPIASIVKLGDRGHNILTMSSAGWTEQKQTQYLNEVFEWFLPMLKQARRQFTEQEPVYENLKSFLLVQAAHIRLNLDYLNQLNLKPTEQNQEPAKNFSLSL